jgi:hypothetical protein
LQANLEYRGSEHGWLAKDFYSRAHKERKKLNKHGTLGTILLLKVKDGPCIGGFTNASWYYQVNIPVSYGDKSAMIFNLTNN